MVKKDLIIVVHAAHDDQLTFKEFCEAAHAPVDYILELVKHGIITPQGDNTESGSFDLKSLQRVKKALRLQHDLEIDVSGLGVVLDLLEQMEMLEKHIALLEKHFIFL